MTDLEGRTVLITGAGSGIGFACAEGFVADGATVYGADIRADRLEALRDAVTELRKGRDDEYDVDDPDFDERMRGLVERLIVGRYEFMIAFDADGVRRAGVLGVVPVWLNVTSPPREIANRCLDARERV